MLDPIADKLLVASCLLMLAADGTIRGWSLWAAIVILCREILVSGLREYLAELRVSVPVTQLAKWKTTLQLVAVGFLLAGEAGDAIVPVVTPIGLSLLWLSALLTLYTGWDYFRAGVRHLIKDVRREAPVFCLGARAHRQARGGGRAAGRRRDRRRSDRLAGRRGEEYAHAFENPQVIRAAIDRTHVRADAAIAGAREIAFFPPMTGG